MFGSEMLDVAIGLVLVYLILSTLASAFRQLAAYFFDQRAKHLQAGIQALLQDEATGLAKQLYSHPLIRDVPEGSGRAASKMPIHIPARSFALSLMDMLSREAAQAAAAPATPPPAAPDTPPTPPAPPASPAPAAPTPILSFASVRAGAALIQDDAVRRAILTALDTAQGSLDRAQANVEAWFNAAMDRVSGWYRRQSQKIVVVAAIGVTVGLNVNTLAIIDQLSTDQAVRAQIVQDAQKRSEASAQAPGDLRQEYHELRALELPIGWSEGWPGVQRALRPVHDRFRPWEDAAQPILGWLITIFAVSLGAPFWFDLLKGMIRMRTGLAAGSASASGGASGET